MSRAEGLSPFRALQRVLYRSAKQDPRRRFHALYDHVARSDVLVQAWAAVRANRGAPGVDGVSIAEVEASGVEEFLQQIAADLRAGSYRPAPLRRVRIPKPGQPDKTRPLSIPTVRDRVVMAAACSVLEPIFEAQFLPCSFGFRPKRSVHMALDAMRAEVRRGREWVLDADLADCFGSLDRDAVMAQVARRVSDRRMLKLIRSWLRVGVLEEGMLAEMSTGTPQGSPISPLLANVALHVLDAEWTARHSGLGVLVRFADDLVVCCASRARAEEARARVAAIVAPLGLRLHPDKTRIVHLAGGVGGFDFLGFHHHKKRSRRRPGVFYLASWPSDRAMRSVRTKVRQATARRNVSRPVEDIVADLNRVLRGWGSFFNWGNPEQKFWDVDRYVYERMRRFLRNKHGPSLGRRRMYRIYPRLGVHRLSGPSRARLRMPDGERCR